MSTRVGSPDRLSHLVLAPAPTIEAVAIDGGAVLVGADRARTYPLNASGALVWACLDGASSLAEISHDLSEGLGVPSDVISVDVENLARELLEQRMAIATGYEPLSPDPALGCECCAIPGDEHEHLEVIVGDGVWLGEPHDANFDAQFPLGRAGEVVARLPADDDSRRFVGIRTDDVDAANAIRERLGPLLADDEPFRFPNVSLSIGNREGFRTSRNIVFRRSVRAFHTFSREQAIDATLAQLHTFVPHDARFTPMRVRALAREGSVVLVSDSFTSVIDAEHRRLSAAGYRALLQTPVLVDAVNREAQLPRSDDWPMPELVGVPVSHVVAPGSPHDAALPAAFSVARAAMLVTRPGERSIRGEDVRALAELTSGVPLVKIDTGDRREIARILIEL